MKYFIVFLFLVTSFFAFAQEDNGGFVGFAKTSGKTSKEVTSVFKVGILPFLFGQIYGTGELRFNYEQTIAKRQSIVAGISYDFPNLLGLAIYSAGASGGRGANGGYNGYGSSPGFLDANYAFEGVRGMLGYRYYFLKYKGAPKGLYAGPYMSYNFVNVRVKSSTQDYEDLHYFDACGVIGFQAITSKHFAFDVTAGLGYRDNFITHTDSNMSLSPQLVNIPPFDHVKLLVQLNFGYGL